MLAPSHLARESYIEERSDLPEEWNELIPKVQQATSEPDLFLESAPSLSASDYIGNVPNAKPLDSWSSPDLVQE